ncbi:MAG: precorrin-8X methylmutase [Geminocystis sp.]|nr:precorrin-8X methylmutase [Geminocystis sp.]
MIEYLRNGEQIYRQSFAIIRKEACLKGLEEGLAKVAVRLIHACGMTDIVKDLEASPLAVEKGKEALRKGAKILCDSEMVAHGIIRRRLEAKNENHMYYKRPNSAHHSP